MSQNDDLISRQAAIDGLKRISFSHWFECGEYLSEDTREIEIISSKKALEVIEALPSAQPTLYGYKIEHLAYIAKVMEKEGVTADYAVRTFDDMGRAIKMIIDEAQQKFEEALNGCMRDEQDE